MASMTKKRMSKGVAMISNHTICFIHCNFPFIDCRMSLSLTTSWRSRLCFNRAICWRIWSSSCMLLLSVLMFSSFFIMCGVQFC